MRSTVARGTGVGRKARTERRLAMASRTMAAVSESELTLTDPVSEMVAQCAAAGRTCKPAICRSSRAFLFSSARTSFS